MTDSILLKSLGARVRSLGNGAAGIVSQLSIKATPGDGSIIDFRASDATLDRYDEVIDPLGWLLDTYTRNPVFLTDHDYSVESVIGKSLLTEVKDGALFQRIQFAVGINPLADMVYKLYKDRILNSVSVGFIPVTWESGTQGSGYSRKFTKQILIELSAVAIGANPNALQLAVDKDALTFSEVKEVRDFLKQFNCEKEKKSSQKSSLTKAISALYLQMK